MNNLVVVAFLTECGRLFQIVEPSTESRFFPLFVFTIWYMDSMAVCISGMVSTIICVNCMKRSVIYFGVFPLMAFNLDITV